MKVYYDGDADLSALEGKTLSLVGYGNQGQAQALNLKDSGFKVVVGNRDDDYAATALQDGFTPVTISEAVASGDVVMILIPDEVQPGVYEEMIAPYLREGQTLCVASGYNIHFGLIKPPGNIPDVIMVAPRTIGRAGSDRFPRRAAGSTPISMFARIIREKPGRRRWRLRRESDVLGPAHFTLSFGVEAELDLFSEQALWPALFECLLTAYDVLVEKGYPREAVVLELSAASR